MKKLRDGKNVILFRFYHEPEVTRERIKILQYFNPGVPIYALHGGEASDFAAHKTAVEDLVEDCWFYPEKRDAMWKWLHGDKMIKAWYRAVGKNIDFDFVFTYEYDLLTAAPLIDIYPNIDDNTLALAACCTFTKELEEWWPWTGKEPYKTYFREFCQFLDENYGIKRPQKICQGPGTLMPKRFLERWDQVPDIDNIHEEIAYPAFAEAFGYETVDHGMHPGIFADREIKQYFHCHRSWPRVTTEMVQKQLGLPDGRRAFHPVKHAITVNDLLPSLKKPDKASRKPVAV